MADPRNLSRRDFVKATTAVLGTIMGVALGLPFVDYLIAPALKEQKADAWIPLGKLADFKPGEPTLVNFTRSKVNGWEKTVTSYGVFVVRKSDAEAAVISNVCTHLSCRVNWNAEQQEYICPCHDGRFGPDGSVRSGPPPRPLDFYQTRVEDGTLSIHFLEG